jgi:hypothetical protein
MSKSIERLRGTAQTKALDANRGSPAPREVNNTIVDGLMTAAFGRPRDARSNEYMQGCRALLERKVNSVPLKCPYRMGTVQADAWFAGTDEGHLIWSDFQRSAKAP